MKIGIIDLGTNTFNLLIVDAQKNKPFQTLISTKGAVMLGSDGLDKGYISDAALDRAFGVLSDFRAQIDQHACTKVFAFGTSALRSAKNAAQFIEKISAELDIQIKLISGDQEAEFIYFGVKEVITFTDENYLILDIGGGSNEFIIANRNELLWKHSFALGGARLLEKFKPANPITEKQIGLINEYLDSELFLLKEALKKYPVTKLVGASGAFDTYADVLSCKKTGLPQPKSEFISHISLSEFDTIYNLIVKSSREERLKIPGLESVRVETIVMAAIFTKFSLTLSGVNEVLQATYSLKEGVAASFKDTHS